MQEANGAQLVGGRRRLYTEIVEQRVGARTMTSDVALYTFVMKRMRCHLQGTGHRITEHATGDGDDSEALVARSSKIFVSRAQRPPLESLASSTWHSSQSKSN